MPRYRVQCARAWDSLLPRDRIVNTIHFDSPVPLGDPEDVCNDVGNAFLTSWYANGAACEVDTRIYVVGTDGPPLAKKVLNEGTAVAKNKPREVALCLSFYAGQNTPRRRGRIYLDPTNNDGVDLRPSEGMRTRAIALGQALSGIGGADVDWGVYSPTTNTFNKITHLWVDNEWDTVRSRGLRATMRDMATTSG